MSSQAAKLDAAKKRLVIVKLLLSAFIIAIEPGFPLSPGRPHTPLKSDARQVSFDMKTKTPSGPSVLKWSTRPADHNAIRVRNNQRRHRARAKEHVEDLEKRLEETSAKLEAALQTISHLAQEVEILRGRVFAPSAWSHLPSTTEIATGVADVQVQPADATPMQDPLDPELPPEGPPQVPDTTAQPSTADAGDSTDCGCDVYPPQAPGESTLPCSSAFRIIEQQNFSGIEVTTIRTWLGPGFRRALRPGEACRVETNRVYELLDHITSSS